MARKSRSNLPKAIAKNEVIVKFSPKILPAPVSISKTGWFEYVSVSALATGLVFSAYQAAGLKKTIHLSSWTAITAQTIEIEKAFLERPRLSRIFYGESVEKSEKESDGPNEQRQAGDLASLNITYFENVLSFLEYVPDDNNIDRGAYVRYFYSTFRKSPFMCPEFQSQRYSYGGSLKALACLACGSDIDRKICENIDQKYFRFLDKHIPDQLRAMPLKSR